MVCRAYYGCFGWCSELQRAFRVFQMRSDCFWVVSLAAAFARSLARLMLAPVGDAAPLPPARSGACWPPEEVEDRLALRGASDASVRFETVPARYSAERSSRSPSCLFSFFRFARSIEAPPLS